MIYASRKRGAGNSVCNVLSSGIFGSRFDRLIDRYTIVVDECPGVIAAFAAPHTVLANGTVESLSESHVAHSMGMSH